MGRGRAWSLVTAASLAASALAGCGAPRVSVAEGPRSYAVEDYDRVLSRWTRSEHLVTLAGLDDLLAVTATFEASDFRWAWAMRWARDHQLSPAERDDLRARSLADAREHHEFYVALEGTQKRWGDLTRSSSAWTVRLVDDRGHATAPEEIRAIARPGADERTYFPYTTPWRQAFRIRFPARTAEGPTIAPDAGLVALRFSGPQGAVDVRWELAR